MVTKYAPGDGVAITANTAAVAMPAVVDMKHVTLAEWNAGTAIQCAIRSLNVTSSTSNRSEQFLCDSDATEAAGATSWSIDPLIIQTGDPQAANPFLDALAKGVVFYLGVRLGVAHAVDGVEGQRLRVFRVEVAGVEDAELAANADGNKYETRVHLAVRRVERDSMLGMSQTPPVDPTPEPTPEPAPAPLPATPLSTMWSVSPGLYSSSQSTFDMLEGGQLTSGLSYKRDPITGPYLDKTGTGIQIASKAGLPDLAQHSFRFYFTYPTLPGSGSTQLLSPMGIVGGALNPVYRLVVTFAGAWRVHDSANAQKVFGTKNLLPGTRYRMEGQATATSITIRIFEGDSDVVWNEASGSALTLGTVQVWRAGQLTSTPEFPLNISRLQLRNTLEWIGPAAAPVAVDATRDRVLIVGDSLTAMNGANGTGGSLAGRPILDGLQQRRFPLQNVVHYGVGGKRLAVADSLGRVPSQTITDAKTVLGSIDHAVIALGTNDSPSTDAEITAAVNQVIADLKAAGVPRVTWIGAVFEAAGSATATRLNGLISGALSSATGITARFINPDPLIHNGRSEAGWWIGDGTHMTPTGYTAARAPIYVDAIAPKA